VSIDYKNYPANWNAISSDIRFNRAQNRCEQCGAENYKPHPQTGSMVNLSVAHLNQDTTDNRPENLKALCQRCHLNYDRSSNKKRRKYGKDILNLPTLNFDEPI